MIRLEKILFYTLIFFLPLQTRKIIWQFGESFNEWSNIYIYLTDLLLLSLFLLWAWRKKEQRFLKEPLFLKEQVKKPEFYLIIFLLFSFASLIQAQNVQISFYAWFKLLEMAGLFFYLRYNFRELFSFPQIAKVILASGLIQSFIVFFQYGLQKSLGLWFLGESPLDVGIPGVANFLVSGDKIIRGYGTLPHPNVLAAFLVFCLFSLFYLYCRQKSGNKIFTLDRLILIVSYFILLFALILTFSRIIIMVFILATLVLFIWNWFKRKDLRRSLYELLCFLLIAVSISFFFLWPEISSRFAFSAEEQSFSLRVFYNETALRLISENPLAGIGLGGFAWQISLILDKLSNWVFQPVHNIYLLIAAETGLVGLTIFLLFLYNLFRKRNQPAILVILLMAFLAIGFFDHFFWTLQQGQLMFWLVLGIIGNICRPHSSTDRV